MGFDRKGPRLCLRVEPQQQRPKEPVSQKGHDETLKEFLARGGEIKKLEPGIADCIFPISRPAGMGGWRRGESQ